MKSTIPFGKFLPTNTNAELQWVNIQYDRSPTALFNIVNFHVN